MSNIETTFATIIISARHNKLSVVRSAVGTSGIINTLMCRFEFKSTDWAGIQKMAVFQSMSDYVKHNEEKKVIIELNEQGECYVPAEVMTGQGEFLVGVFGVYENNNRIVSNMLAFKCDKGCYCIGSTPSDATPGGNAEILALIDKKQDKLIAGDGIKISEDNIISCTCGDIDITLISGGDSNG